MLFANQQKCTSCRLSFVSKKNSIQHVHCCHPTPVAPRLVEQTEAHVVVGLLLLLLLGGLGGGLSGATSGSSTSGGGGTSTTGGNGGELLRAGSDQLGGVLVACPKSAFPMRGFANFAFFFLICVPR